MAFKATYRCNGEERTFSRATETVKPPKDESINAPVAPQPGEPLYELRMDAESVQFQLNEFLTLKKEAASKKA